MVKQILFLSFASTALSAVIARNSSCTPGSIISNGRQCTVECGTDHAGGDYSSLSTSDFQTCINACSSDTNCVTAQYAISSSYCYLKNGINPGSANTNVDSITCPKPTVSSCVSGPIVLNGRQGTIECGTDHPGGDYSSKYAGSLQACENLCAADPACATAQYATDSKYCYLKSAINPGTANSNVNGVVFTQPTSCLPYSQGSNYISNGGFESGLQYISTSAYQGSVQTNVTQGTEFEGCHALVLTPTSDPLGNRQYALTWSYSNLRPYNQYTFSATVGRPAGGFTKSLAPTMSVTAEHRSVGGASICGFADTGSCNVVGAQGAVGQTVSTSFYVLYSSSSLTLVFTWLGATTGNDPIILDNIRLFPVLGN